MSGMRLMISAVDYHTEGEPFRIVTGGVPPLRGRTILEKRQDAMDRLDHVRALLVNEPRGHADMYGGFVTDPEDEGAQLGVVFFHNAGYSTACGHGTIALVTWAHDSGLISMSEPESTVTVDVPSGRLATVASVSDGRVRSVRFRNVPSFVAAERLKVATRSGEVSVDVAYGGAFYALVDAGELELPVQPAFLPRFIELGREIKSRVEADREVVHPLQPELRGIYGVIFTEGNRNVTVFADGEVDRSPCGSGTSARLALLWHRRQVAAGEPFTHESIIGTRFLARIAGETAVGDHPAVITEVSGSAHLTGFHQFVLDPGDPLATGFLLR